MGHVQSVLATIKVGSQYMLIHLILGSVTTFTSANSSLRYMAIFVIIGLAMSIQSAVYQTHYVPTPLRGILAMGAWIQVFNSYDILVHKRINYAEHREWKKEKGLIANGGTIWFTLSIPNNFRRLDTKWQTLVAAQEKFFGEENSSKRNSEAFFSSAVQRCMSSWPAPIWTGSPDKKRYFHSWAKAVSYSIYPGSVCRP
ncbi:unnamed protein product [Penicillium pancosmium]